MTHEERNNIIAIFVSLLANGYMIWKLNSLYASGAFDGPDALQIFGKTVLWIIPICIVLTIVMTIVGNILFAIAAGESNPDFTVDERDRGFQMRGFTVTMITASFGFILALVALAFGWQALSVFVLIYLSFAIADLLGNIVKLISYRMGV